MSKTRRAKTAQRKRPARSGQKPAVKKRAAKKTISKTAPHRPPSMKKTISQTKPVNAAALAARIVSTPRLSSPKEARATVQGWLDDIKADGTGKALNALLG